MAVAAVALAAAVAIVCYFPNGKNSKTSDTAQNSATTHKAAATENDGSERTAVQTNADCRSSGASESEPPPSEVATTERNMAARTAAFDTLVDKWSNPAESEITTNDMAKFVATFQKVPRKMREDGLRRALNLIPDENALLLVGVLMDKSQPKEFVKLVYNDILNRPEEIKMPILQEIFKDKTHPCWDDTAWVLDTTDETP